MYQVIRMYGDCEPWWFLDGWEESIISSKEYNSYEEALQDYQYQCKCLSERFTRQKSQGHLMVAFWDPTDQRWCDECDEYLQNYHSLLLLEVGEDKLPELPKNQSQKQRVCRMKWKRDIDESEFSPQ